ncbi:MULTISPECIES: NepR family anti-sigma factor [unclassified Epibacterium]|jgi:hypothetical protein|uniref:NepR family anti-sigma factor n=1 Tax=unclassified Epibacterium TaxID=2639179 RepID=UPI001EF4CF1A|nr:MULTISPECIES: NepR family anti-sigma factor [unclassified Epibacterium]MCG7621793.1 hypothetical protein [Epibacterium sp. Ofav1-8]MCG7627218.1 hypothetical protein [Epibacterium sp. MM17-32]
MANRPQKQPWDTLIDENLKRVFDEDANAELPPHLMELLDRLDKIPVADASGTTGATSQSQEEAE